MQGHHRSRDGARPRHRRGQDESGDGGHDHLPDARLFLCADQNCRAQALICGDCDPLVSKRCETELLTGLPNIVRVEIENCGHMAIYTHPELLAELTAEFLAGGCGMEATHAGV